MRCGNPPSSTAPVNRHNKPGLTTQTACDTNSFETGFMSSTFTSAGDSDFPMEDIDMQATLWPSPNERESGNSRLNSYINLNNLADSETDANMIDMLDDEFPSELKMSNPRGRTGELYHEADMNFMPAGEGTVTGYPIKEYGAEAKTSGSFRTHMFPRVDNSGTEGLKNDTKVVPYRFDSLGKDVGSLLSLSIGGGIEVQPNSNFSTREVASKLDEADSSRSNSSIIGQSPNNPLNHNPFASRATRVQADAFAFPNSVHKQSPNNQLNHSQLASRGTSIQSNAQAFPSAYHRQSPNNQLNPIQLASRDTRIQTGNNALPSSFNRESPNNQFNHTQLANRPTRIQTDVGAFQSSNYQLNHTQLVSRPTNSINRQTGTDGLPSSIYRQNSDIQLIHTQLTNRPTRIQTDVGAFQSPNYQLNHSQLVSRPTRIQQTDPGALPNSVHGQSPINQLIHNHTQLVNRPTRIQTDAGALSSSINRQGPINQLMHTQLVSRPTRIQQTDPGALPTSVHGQILKNQLTHNQLASRDTSIQTGTGALPSSFHGLSLNNQLTHNTQLVSGAPRIPTGTSALPNSFHRQSPNNQLNQAQLTSRATRIRDGAGALSSSSYGNSIPYSGEWTNFSANSGSLQFTRPPFMLPSGSTSLSDLDRFNSSRLGTEQTNSIYFANQSNLNQQQEFYRERFMNVPSNSSTGLLSDSHRGISTGHAQLGYLTPQTEGTRTDITEIGSVPSNAQSAGQLYSRQPSSAEAFGKSSFPQRIRFPVPQDNTFQSAGGDPFPKRLGVQPNDLSTARISEGAYFYNNNAGNPSRDQFRPPLAPSGQPQHTVTPAQGYTLRPSAPSGQQQHQHGIPAQFLKDLPGFNNSLGPAIQVARPPIVPQQTLKRPAMENPATAPLGQRRKVIPQPVINPSMPYQIWGTPPPVPATSHVKSQGYLDEPSQPTGNKCFLCKRDLTFTAADGPYVRPSIPPPVAVLPCGHTFHDECLEKITPQDQSTDPPCLPCAMGDET